MNKIVGIGANVHDTLITVSAYPAEDTKQQCVSVTESGGGPCATGLVAAAKLGASCAYIGALAADNGGTFLLNDMERFGVSSEYTDIVSGKSTFSSYILLNSENATRTCVFNKKNLPTFTLDERKKEAVRSAEVLMVDGNELDNALEAAALARKSGTKVLYDAGGLYNGIEQLLPLADILIPSEEFALGFTGAKTAEDAALALYKQFSSEVIVITQGKSGGLLLHEGRIQRYPAFSVHAVDTNGAGDVFHGAFAFAVTKGLSYYDACIFSSAVSAIKCTKTGAREASPDYKETIDFIKEWKS